MKSKKLLSALMATIFLQNIVWIEAILRNFGSGNFIQSGTDVFSGFVGNLRNVIPGGMKDKASILNPNKFIQSGTDFVPNLGKPKPPSKKINKNNKGRVSKDNAESNSQSVEEGINETKDKSSRQNQHNFIQSGTDVFSGFVGNLKNAIPAGMNPNKFIQSGTDFVPGIAGNLGNVKPPSKKIIKNNKGRVSTDKAESNSQSVEEGINETKDKSSRQNSHNFIQSGTDVVGGIVGNFKNAIPAGMKGSASILNPNKFFQSGTDVLPGIAGNLGNLKPPSKKTNKNNKGKVSKDNTESNSQSVEEGKNEAKDKLTRQNSHNFIQSGTDVVGGIVNNVENLKPSLKKINKNIKGSQSGTDFASGIIDIAGKVKNEANDKASRYNKHNFIQSGSDVVGGIVNNLGNLIPTANEIFSLGTDAILGYPFKATLTAIHLFCSAALASDAVKPKFLPDITKMTFQLITQCKRDHIPLKNAGKLLQLENFKKDKNVVIFVTGWTTNANVTQNAKELAKAYNCRDDTNFILLDAAHFVDTLYSWSAFNTDEIGRLVAVGLRVLIKSIAVEKFHLIGHSLGAHIVGAAGRHFTQLTKKILPRITGLDPANPCFNEGEQLSGLMRGDADLVDVIHSNSGALGIHDPVGDADFYPGGVMILTPGCSTIECAHNRAWEYFVESVYPGNEDNFMATRCTSLGRLSRGLCRDKAVPMGFALPKKAKGNFVLPVNGESPFGENSDPERTEEHANCGSCEKAHATTEKTN